MSPALSPSTLSVAETEVPIHAQSVLAPREVLPPAPVPRTDVFSRPFPEARSEAPPRKLQAPKTGYFQPSDSKTFPAPVPMSLDPSKDSTLTMAAAPAAACRPPVEEKTEVT